MDGPDALDARRQEYLEALTHPLGCLLHLELVEVGVFRQEGIDLLTSRASACYAPGYGQADEEPDAREEGEFSLAAARALSDDEAVIFRLAAAAEVLDNREAMELFALPGWEAAFCRAASRHLGYRVTRLRDAVRCIDERAEALRKAGRRRLAGSGQPAV